MLISDFYYIFYINIYGSRLTIYFPDAIISEEVVYGMQLSHEDIIKMLPDRKAESHKGNYGKLLLICGSMCYTGAPYLATMGALRSGAGLVYLGVPSSIHNIEAMKLTEPVIIPLDSVEGMLSVTSCAQIAPFLNKVDAVLVGPGLGQAEGTEAVVQYVLNEFKGPVVVDADGINVLVQHKDILRRRTEDTILTPHEGEFMRLGGDKERGRVTGAQALAKDLGCIVVLKGHHTVITDAVNTYINPTGNPGMATGGSGDLLAGIITAMLGLGLSSLEAAAAGAWLHGASGDICAESIGKSGMLPSDMISVLPQLLK